MQQSTADYKKMAAEHAVRYIKSGMTIGLGHGSTTIYAVRLIADLLGKNELSDIIGIPCSREVEQEAQKLGIYTSTLNEFPLIDITIDGADEVDPDLNLIKGGGGALLREKLIAQATKRQIIVIDDTKLSPQLGSKWAVPIEVIPYGWRTQIKYLENLGGVPKLRHQKNRKPFITDQQNYILDTNFGPIKDLEHLAEQLKTRTGLVEHGLFLGLTTEVIVAGPKGIRSIKKNKDR
jgi:ribose 5-phosphate isomerase A